MTVQAEDLFRAPTRDNLLDDDVLTPLEAQQVQQIEEKGSSAASMAAVALALGASFLLYRRYMRRKLLGEVRNNWTADALDLSARVSWSPFVPIWVRMVTPVIDNAYRFGVREAAMGSLPPHVLEQAAQEYARSLGEYMNATSAQALQEGFNSYVNRKMVRRAAAEKVINAIGLTPRQMRSVASAEHLAEQSVTSVLSRSADSKMERHIETLLLGRAKQMGENESFAIVNQGKQLTWMWQAQKGNIPEHAKKEWVTSRDEQVCEHCGPMHRKTAPVNKPFETDLGEVWMPSLHPSCRCSVRLRISITDMLNPHSLVDKALPDAALADFNEEHPRGDSGQFRDKNEQAAPIQRTPENEAILAELNRLFGKEKAEPPKKVQPARKVGGKKVSGKKVGAPKVTVEQMKTSIPTPQAQQLQAKPKIQLTPKQKQDLAAKNKINIDTPPVDPKPVLPQPVAPIPHPGINSRILTEDEQVYVIKGMLASYREDAFFGREAFQQGMREWWEDQENLAVNQIMAHGGEAVVNRQEIYLDESQARKLFNNYRLGRNAGSESRFYYKDEEGFEHHFWEDSTDAAGQIFGPLFDYVPQVLHYDEIVPDWDVYEPNILNRGAFVENADYFSDSDQNHVIWDNYPYHYIKRILKP